MCSLAVDLLVGDLYWGGKRGSVCGHLMAVAEPVDRALELFR